MTTEIQKIKEQFAEVIRHSQNIPNPQLDKLFDNWFNAKERIIRYLFGNQLILNLGRVSYNISTDAKRNKIGIFYNWVSQFYPTTKALEDFLSSLTPEEFYDNHLVNDYIFDDKKINKGTKVIKAFKHFINDEELLEAIQNKASELIQENKISGELILSVHPLDFLSSSENNAKWRSCHALDGEYRVGNLSYMQDRTTIIAYLRGEGGETHKLPNFPESVPWNNKKWRCLFFIDNQEDSSIIFAGRPYPMAVDGILESVRLALIARLNSHNHYWCKPDWTEWSDETVTAVTVGENTHYNRVDGYYFFLGTEIFRNNHLIKDAKHSMHYNDLLHSSCYKPLYCYDKSSYFDSGTKLRIGAEATCLWCGEDYVSTRDTMMCKQCECEHGPCDNDDYMHCEYCGARHYNADMYEVDGAWICPHCYETHTFTCVCCGERYPNHEQRYSEVLKGFVCYDCHHEEERKKELEKAQELREKFKVNSVNWGTTNANNVRMVDIQSGEVTELPDLATISYTEEPQWEIDHTWADRLAIWSTEWAANLNVADIATLTRDTTTETLNAIADRERNESSNGEGS